MLDFLLTSSFLINLIILILVLFLFFGLLEILKSYGKNYKFKEKIKIVPHIIFKSAETSFAKFSYKKRDGTFTKSFSHYKSLSKIIRSLSGSALLFLVIKILLLSLIFNLPRPGEAQPDSWTYKDTCSENFSKGTYNQTEWYFHGIALKSGQYFGNYISQPIGQKDYVSQWQNLSWQADLNYGQRPAYPSNSEAWTLDSLEKCSNEYSCQLNQIDLKKGMYNTSAYYFNGNDSLAKINKNIIVNGSFTIAAWINLKEAIYNGWKDQDFVIFAKGYGDYLADPPYLMKKSLFFGFKDGSLHLIFWSDENQDHWVQVKNTDYKFLVDNWYHVAGVYDNEAKTLKLYINGFEQTGKTEDYDGGEINHAPNASKSYPSWLGSFAYRWIDGEDSPVEVFHGSIDEVFIANQALGLFELRQWMNQANELLFQVRYGNSLPLSSPFVGPDYKQAAYFTNSESNDLSFLPPSKYLQYIMFLSRPSTNYNLNVSEVTISYLPTEKTNNLAIALEEEQPDQIEIQPVAEAPRNLDYEKKAIDLFIQFFKELPSTDLDWEFVNVTAYNNVEQRSLSKEETALTGFINFMKKLPITEIDWGIIKALSYTLKGEVLLESWLNLK